MKDKTINLIVAMDENNAIGNNGGLLCHLPNDLRYFKRITDGHTVVMGRRTFESLPNGALPNRKNIVITTADAEKFPDCTVLRSLDEALAQHDGDSQFFVIGGGQLYRAAFPLTDTLFLTRIHHIFSYSDTFFPEIDFSRWELVDEENHEADEKHKYAYTFLKYKRII
ncbi:MAG: dihydrofolate reductase [Dysgonamonadaceae bacterium]|nr:dihydrofolate reductase [Dysgonamonadaceae bacterium]